jgi:ribosomal subunit interface protein
MQIQVSGKHVDVGEALRTRISDELLSSIGKYFERGGDADVVLSREGHSFRIDCSVTLATGHRLQSHGLGGDAHGAFGQALSKIEARIRRYKRRLTSHSAAAEAKVAELSASYVLRAPAEDEEDDWSAGSAESPPAAVVIAESQEALKTMTVSMAVMDLDLTEQQAIMFRNAAHGGLAVVYRRVDGNIGWLDAERTKGLNGAGSTGRH